jgi:two-component system sensor histidine kinase ChvG
MTLARADVKRIDRLITDISDASRLDAELSRDVRGPIDLSHLLKIIVEIYQVTGNPRGLAVTLVDDLPGGARVLGNDERLGQVFRNLIDNAISFSPDGGKVIVTARIHAPFARITVEDQGPGIPPENLESIFDRFYTERPAAHFGKNSGLGLSIARQITQNAGGRIWAENKDGGGARFVVDLPVLP